jgi:hypothetical protein
MEAERKLTLDKELTVHEYPIIEVRPKGKVGLKELTPLQAVGYRLAVGVLIIIGALLLLTMIDLLSIASQLQTIQILNPSLSANDLETRINLATTLNQLMLDRVSEIFDFVGTSILPLLSAIIGFLFGAKSTQENS